MKKFHKITKFFYVNDLSKENSQSVPEKTTSPSKIFLWKYMEFPHRLTCQIGIKKYFFKINYANFNCLENTSYSLLVQHCGETEHPHEKFVRTH